MEKAFDSVWKRGLIVKMTKLKIQGKVIRLIDDFLQSRIVQLHINGFEGDKKETEELVRAKLNAEDNVRVAQLKSGKNDTEKNILLNILSTVQELYQKQGQKRQRNF